MDSSRPHIVRDSSTAALLMQDSPRRQLLLSMIKQSRSIAEIAREAGLQIGRAHYLIRDFERRGLVEVERSVSRRGRPIRYYRAISDGFFIPIEQVTASPGAGLAAELRDRLDDELARSDEDGILFDTNEAGEPRVSWFQAPSRRNVVAEFWRMPKLSNDDARALIDDLRALLDRYELKASGNRTFLAHAAVVPRS